MNIVIRSVVNHPYISLTILIVLAAVVYTMVFFPQTQAENIWQRSSPKIYKNPKSKRFTENPFINVLSRK